MLKPLIEALSNFVEVAPYWNVNKVSVDWYYKGGICRSSTILECKSLLLRRDTKHR